MTKQYRLLLSRSMLLASIVAFTIVQATASRVLAEKIVGHPDELKFEVVKRAADYLRGKRETVEVDGVRVLFEEGWGLVRASNTQPMLVMRFEAKRPKLLIEYRKEVETAVEQAKRAIGA